MADRSDLEKEIISAARQEEIIEELEAPTRKFTGPLWYVVTALSVACSLFALYTAISPAMTQLVRGVHVLFVLMLTFLYYPAIRRNKSRGLVFDLLLALLSLIALAYPFLDFEPFIYRVATPTALDLGMGIVTILLVLEATRRSTGMALPLLVLACIAYAFWGPLLPDPWAHRGYTLKRVVAHEYMTLEGLFGIPVGVS